jgi:hypothetical protein
VSSPVFHIAPHPFQASREYDWIFTERKRSTGKHKDKPVFEKQEFAELQCKGSKAVLAFHLEVVSSSSSCS